MSGRDEMEILVNKDTRLSVCYSECVLLYWNILFKAALRTTYCMYVNSCRMWITSETELKQQSDADLLFLFIHCFQKWPVYVWTGSDRSDLWSIWTDIRVKKLQMDFFWEWRVNIVSLASHDDLNLDIKQQQQEPNLHNWTLIKGHLCWFLLLFLRLS